MFHNEEIFHLARSDMKTVHGKNVETWTPPEEAAIACNARWVRRFLAELKERDSA